MQLQFSQVHLSFFTRHHWNPLTKFLLLVNYKAVVEVGMQCWSYGVVVAHRTLNPVTRVQSSVGPSFFPKLGNQLVIAAIIFCEIESDLIHLV